MEKAEIGLPKMLTLYVLLAAKPDGDMKFEVNPNSDLALRCSFLPQNSPLPPQKVPWSHRELT